MKGKTLLALACASVMLLAACNKDGVYNPSKKISRVYAASTYSYTSSYGSDSEATPKHLTEFWHWDGNKLISLDYYTSNGAIDETYNFTYDGKQLTRIDCYAYNYYVEFTYDGSKLSKYDVYEAGALVRSLTCTYDGGKLAKVDIMTTNKGTKNEKTIAREANIMGLIMPCFDKEAYVKNVATKAAQNITINYTWDGKNISQQEQIAGAERAVYKYTYDENTNPYQGFLLEDATLFSSKNNIISQVATYTDPDGTETDQVSYSYTYDGKWPTMRTYTRTYNEENYSSSSTYQTYWEYED
ncbi:MAG: hypothetical protein IKP83_00690 [Bacteroidales bacterium]|nr:hypothetical protein [Bacteroidales bacterium]